MGWRAERVFSERYKEITAAVLRQLIFSSAQDDVIFTFERAKDSSYCSSTMGQIAEIIKVDDMTVQMKLNTGNTDFDYNAGSENVAILSKEAFETMPEEQAVAIGTGTFKFVEYVPGEN